MGLHRPICKTDDFPSPKGPMLVYSIYLGPRRDFHIPTLRPNIYIYIYT